MKTKLVSLITFILLSAVSAKAQMCANLFDGAKIPGKKWVPPGPYVPHTNQLSPAKLAKYKLGLSADNTVLLDYDTPSGKPVALGKILISDAEYLFEWASKEEHKDWMQDSGISNAHMAEILKAESQVAGKGFYVSLNPVDSSTYGDTLTAFQTKGAVVVLEFFKPSKKYDNAAKVQNLSKAGIDGIRHFGYSKNWLSVISNRQLQVPKAAPIELFRSLFNDLNFHALPVFELNALAKFPKAGWKLVSKDVPIGRFVLGESMTIEQLASIKIPFTSKMNIYEIGMSEHWQQSYLIQLANHAFKAKDAEDFLMVLEALKGLQIQAEIISAFEKELETLNPAPKYRANLDHSDTYNEPITWSVLKSWIQLAKNDQDFALRSRLAVEMFNQVHPEGIP